MAWVTIGNPVTGGTAVVPQSSLALYASAGWVQADDSPPPTPETGLAADTADANAGTEPAKVSRRRPGGSTDTPEETP